MRIASRQSPTVRATAGGDWTGKTYGLQLSPECKDLLDRIFVTDEKQRITVTQIKEHAWTSKTLSAKYEEAEAQIRRLQAEHDEYTTNRKISGVSL